MHARHCCPDTRMAVRRNPTIRFDLCCRWFANIVEQCRDQQLRPFWCREYSPVCQANQRFGDHTSVDQHIAFAMMNRILWSCLQLCQPWAIRHDFRPIELPCWRPRNPVNIIQRYHSSTPARNRFGSNGRSIQWLPESSTVCKNPGRTYL